jgi:hypothetical protein
MNAPELSRQATRIAAATCLAVINIFDAGCVSTAGAAPIQYPREQRLASSRTAGKLNANLQHERGLTRDCL